MSQARFQSLEGDRVGVVRVYHHADTTSSAPYKFFIAAVIHGDQAEILGLVDADITNRDISAIARELVKDANAHGKELKLMYWHHNGERHELPLARYQIPLNFNGVA